MAKTGRQSFQFMLRLPDELRDRLRDAAEAKGRSVTAEIIERLEESFEFPQREKELRTELAECGQTVNELEHDIEELKEELQRKDEYAINRVADIKRLETNYLEQKRRLEGKELEAKNLRDELSEVRAILSTYTDYADGLRRIEELIRSLAEDLKVAGKKSE